MRRTWITLIIFVLFLLEGSVLPWLLPDVWLGRVYVSPHFAFVFILYVTLYLSRHLALAYGLGFGLLKDIVFFGPMIGTLSFTMGLSAYLIGLGFHRPKIRLASTLFFCRSRPFTVRMHSVRLVSFVQSGFHVVSLGFPARDAAGYTI